MHALRHSFAHELATEKVSMPVIQSALGHSSLGTTSIYLRAFGRCEGAERERERESVCVCVVNEAALAAGDVEKRGEVMNPTQKRVRGYAWGFSGWFIFAGIFLVLGVALTLPTVTLPQGRGLLVVAPLAAFSLSAIMFMLAGIYFGAFLIGRVLNDSLGEVQTLTLAWRREQREADRSSPRPEKPYRGPKL